MNIWRFFTVWRFLNIDWRKFTWWGISHFLKFVPLNCHSFVDENPMCSYHEWLRKQLRQHERVFLYTEMANHWRTPNSLTLFHRFTYRFNPQICGSTNHEVVGVQIWLEISHLSFTLLLRTIFTYTLIGTEYRSHLSSDGSRSSLPISNGHTCPDGTVGRASNSGSWVGL